MSVGLWCHADENYLSFTMVKIWLEPIAAYLHWCFQQDYSVNFNISRCEWPQSTKYYVTLRVHIGLFYALFYSIEWCCLEIYSNVVEIYLLFHGWQVYGDHISASHRWGVGDQLFVETRYHLYRTGSPSESAPEMSEALGWLSYYLRYLSLTVYRSYIFI